MPPKPRAIRDNSDMVDDNALHITPEQGAIFGEAREVMKKAEADALRERAAEAETLREQLAHALEQQGQGNALAIQEDGGLMVQGFQFSPTGLIAPESFSEEAWQQVGMLLNKLEGSIQWLIGDWIIYGGQVGWGDIPKLADALGREAQTLYNYSSVAKAFEIYRRRENLSFGHHDAVTKYTHQQQDQYLDYAERGEAKALSVSRFRAWIKEQHGEQSTPTLSSGFDFDATYKVIRKLSQRNPATAKDQEREKAHKAYADMQALLKAFGHQWGIE